MSRTSNTGIPLPARIYLCTIWLVGIAVLALSGMHWESPDLIKFGGFLALAILSAGIEIPSPAAGTLPLTFLFVLFGACDLTLPETTILASVMTLCHFIWNRSQRPRVDQVVFQVATMAIASAAVVWFHRLELVANSLGNWELAAKLSPVVQAGADATVMFVLSTIPVVLAVKIAEGAPFFRTWRQFAFWSTSYYYGGAMVALVASIAGSVVGWPTVLFSGPAIYLVLRSYRLYVTRIENDKKHAEAMSSLHLRTIEALALAIEAKDDNTHDHLARVQVYAYEIGKELKINESEQEALRAASILHDIGKLAVPEHIISKPGKLTPEEFEKMKIHPTVGAEILERVEFPYPVAPIVRAHHEKWDGTGYPNGIKGEAIPIGARILSVVDCFDALASDRQYRRALPLTEAIKIVQKDSGSAFDPRVVDVLSRRYVELERMAKRHQAPEAAKLSKNVKVERGVAPGAGFEASAAAAKITTGPPIDFLVQIASARHEVQALYEMCQELGNSLSIEETLSIIAAKLRRLVPHHALAVWICKGSELHPAHVAGEDEELFSGLRIPMGQGLSGWVAENRKAMLNGNPMVESGYLNDPARCSQLKSAIAVPLEGLNGVVGVITMYSSGRDAFSKDHLRVLAAASSKIALSIENAMRYEHAEASATTDLLTGLMNARTLFMQLDAELSRSRRANTPVAVVTLDLDGFKHVNSQFGLAEGDRTLRAVASALKRACREYDLVARMGGDEFAIVFPGAHPNELTGRIDQVRNAIAQAARETMAGEQLSVSLGCAFFPQNGAHAELLLAEAERLMYREKELHRGQQPERKPVRFRYERTETLEMAHQASTLHF